MKLLPSSLAARTVLLVIAIVAVAEWVTFSLVLKKGDVAHMRQTTQFVVGQIRLMQTVLPGLDDEARRRLEARDVGEPGIQLVPDGPAVPEYSPRFGFASDLAERLGNKLDEPVILRHDGRREPGGLWIGFMAGGERWWLVLPPPRFKAPSLPHDLWLWLAATLATLMLIAGLFVRGIVRPLANLGAAVDAVGDGSTRKVEPEGPSEVRRLAVQHNTMVDRLAAEIVTMAGTCLRRLDLLEREVPVVLGGGILQAKPPLLMARVYEGLRSVAPRAQVVPLTAPPILGAQVIAGRWRPAGPETPSGMRRPSTTPAQAMAISGLAVVVGEFGPSSGFRSLKEAIEEGRRAAQASLPQLRQFMG